ncbi:MAG: type I 3-dehydroquinate dehydratase [Nitrospirota bacterium]
MMICAPIKRKTTGSLISSIKEAQKHVEVIEVWFDELKSLKEEDLKSIFAIKSHPFIYKCQNPENIDAILKFNPEFIDLDIETPPKHIKKIGPKTSLIISHHNFKETPSLGSLRALAKKIKAKGADIIKIATQANEFEDSVRMLSLLSELHEKGEKAICICMGEKGQITRTAGLTLGNYLMYAPIKDSDASAPGQLTVKQLQWHLK